MTIIGKRISQENLDDFVYVVKVAKDLGLNPQTIKRWLKQKKVDGAVWGYDRRNWTCVHKDSVKLLKRYRDSVKLK